MMVAASGIYRSFGFAVGALLLLFGLLQVLKSVAAPSSQAAGLRKFGDPRTYGLRDGSTQRVRIKKVSALIGEPNHLYEAALKTHERHNRIHGYEMQVLRQRIATDFREKPSFLLSLIVEELAKPAADRVDWLLWVNPDTIVLNPQIPLELFLPPANETDFSVIATHDSRGFNSGVFFLRVNQWTLQLLIQVMSTSFSDNELDLSTSKDQPAFESVFEISGYRGRTLYQPRSWFNAFHAEGRFEGQRGDMLVQFADVNADKWVAMDAYLSNVTKRHNPWEMKLKDTAYEPILVDFWGRIAQARDLLSQAEEAEKTEMAVHEAADNMRYTIEHAADNFEAMISAILALKKATKARQWE